MAVKWTNSQRKAIELSNRNVLVSAAAGSGKTAVLVERILEKIISPTHPVDIDRLLMVTFTNAAAAEMKDRVRIKLEEMLNQNPENEQLVRQRALMPQAHITTIDSFCLQVVKSYFYKIALDPGFRIGDEGELQLLRQDVLDSVLTQAYEEMTPEFRFFAKCYATAKGDEAIREMTERLFDYSESYPWPELWLDSLLENFQIETEDALENSGWVRYLFEQICLQLKDISADYARILSICEEDDGPSPYGPVFLEEKNFVDSLLLCENYRDLYSRFQQLKFKVRPRRKKTDTYDENKAKQAADLRDLAKKRLTDLKKKYFEKNPEDILSEIKRTAPVAAVLIDLVKSFAKAYNEKKRARNLVDFSDVEHFALQILTEGEGTDFQPSEIAQIYKEQFEEILIDEYQDSNYVQEYILSSISREKDGTPNIFMVGDVKQSIYGFRLAKPELFMDKYDTYTYEESKYQKIELRQNFRSRSDVLHSINYLFHQIMREDLGRVEYTREAALYPGAVYGKSEDASTETEILLLDPDLEADAFPMDPDALDLETEDKENLKKQELEAAMVAERILALTDEKTGMSLWDASLETYRKARFGDIVILLRSMSGWSDSFVRILTLYGIPAAAESRNGYFSTFEVRLVLNLLRVIDNPAQDIPLASVLRSCIVGLRTSELARVKTAAGSTAKDSGLYDCVCFYLEHYPETEIGGKLLRLRELLEKYQKKVCYEPLQMILRQLYDETGLYDYITAMPAGSKRRANLDMLAEKAAVFETTSYHGLFQFVRYMEKLKKYSVDYGEASEANGMENMVRIMSIHKSKGLEFPIVFVSGMGKRFNKTDIASPMVIHPDFGISFHSIDPERRIRKKTLMKQVFQKRIEQDTLGEELRILYVALTRAKEKLIMTGSHEEAASWLKNKMQVLDSHREFLSFSERESAACYLDWIIPAVLKHRSMDCLYQTLQMPSHFDGSLFSGLPGWEYEDWKGFYAQIYTSARLHGSRTRRLLADASRKEALMKISEEEVPSTYMSSMLHTLFEYDYHYGPERRKNAVLSVSDIKRRYMEAEDGEFSVTVFSEDGSKESSFGEDRSLRKPQDEKSGADYGTLIHRIMEHLSFEAPMDLNRERAKLLHNGVCTEEELNLVNWRQIDAFVHSDLSQRMCLAKRQGKLFREIPFVLGEDPFEDDLKDKQAERVSSCGHPAYSGTYMLINGIIDAYFEEENEWIIVDYKTDRVPFEEGEDVLLARYRIQLMYYKKALEQLTGKRVKAGYLYSMHLKKEICCLEE